jgi:hypothetical protein
MQSWRVMRGHICPDAIFYRKRTCSSRKCQEALDYLWLICNL